MLCAICSQPLKDDELSTVRQKWLDAGGYGQVPDEAIVHQVCDEKEEGKLTATTIRLPQETIDALKRAAKKEYRTPRAMARMLLIEGLKERGYVFDDQP